MKPRAGGKAKLLRVLFVMALGAVASPATGQEPEGCIGYGGLCLGMTVKETAARVLEAVEGPAAGWYVRPNELDLHFIRGRLATIRVATLFDADTTAAIQQYLERQLGKPWEGKLSRDMSSMARWYPARCCEVRFIGGGDMGQVEFRWKQATEEPLPRPRKERQ